MRYLVFTILLFLQDGPKSITDYFRLFMKDGDASLKESENNEVIIDEANAYIKVIDHGTDDYRFDTEIVFVYFMTSTKAKIFGYSVIERGPNTDRFDCSFYKYEKQQWIDVTKQVLPEEFSLELFAHSPEDVDGVGSQYQLQMTLPQKGTTIVVKPQPVGETDNPFSEDSDGYSHYLQIFSRLARNEIQLKWSRDKGIFEVVK